MRRHWWIVKAQDIQYALRRLRVDDVIPVRVKVIEDVPQLLDLFVHLLLLLLVGRLCLVTRTPP